MNVPINTIRAPLQGREGTRFVYIESAWVPYQHDIPAKIRCGEIGEWLEKNVGPMGNPRLGVTEWGDAKWGWSLGSGKFGLPMGIYFVDSEDLMRFKLTFPEITKFERLYD